VRFWEPRRVLYNALLTGVVVLCAALNWQSFRAVRPGPLLLALLVLGLLANLCYSAAYLLEWPLQAANRGAGFAPWRWSLWAAGTALSMLVASYWMLDEVLAGLSG
jgi:hypothetical protein